MSFHVSETRNTDRVVPDRSYRREKGHEKLKQKLKHIARQQSTHSLQFDSENYFGDVTFNTTALPLQTGKKAAILALRQCDVDSWTTKMTPSPPPPPPSALFVFVSDLIDVARFVLRCSVLVLHDPDMSGNLLVGEKTSKLNISSQVIPFHRLQNLPD